MDPYSGRNPRSPAQFENYSRDPNYDAPRNAGHRDPPPPPPPPPPPQGHGSRREYPETDRYGNLIQYENSHWPRYASDERPRGNDPPVSTRLNTYFLPGEGISREVIQADICRYLGPDATCMPVKDGTGYNIRAYRQLTTPMIETLMADSKRWEEELRRATGRHHFRQGSEDREPFPGGRANTPTGAAAGYPSHVRSGNDPRDYGNPPRESRNPNPTQQYTQEYTGGMYQQGSGLPPEYVIGSGPGTGYRENSGAVPRGDYENFPPGYAPRSGTMRTSNHQGPYAGQTGMQGTPTYDPTNGQMLSPPGTGRGYEVQRHAASTDQSRRR